MSFTFTELGFPACDAADDPFNGFNVLLSRAVVPPLALTQLEFFLDSWAVQKVNHEIYGTVFYRRHREPHGQDGRAADARGTGVWGMDDQP